MRWVEWQIGEKADLASKLQSLKGLKIFQETSRETLQVVELKKLLRFKLKHKQIRTFF